MKPRRIPQRNAITRACARSALSALLVQTQALDRLTGETLARTYGVPAREIDAMLSAEKQRRARK